MGVEGHKGNKAKPKRKPNAKKVWRQWESGREENEKKESTRGFCFLPAWDGRSSWKVEKKRKERWNEEANAGIEWRNYLYAAFGFKKRNKNTGLRAGCLQDPKKRSERRQENREWLTAVDVDGQDKAECVMKTQKGKRNIQQNDERWAGIRTTVRTRNQKPEPKRHCM